MATQKNLPPIAALTVDKTEITLPDNKVTVDASASYDPIKNGRVIRTEFYADAGATVVNPIISEPNPYKTDVTFGTVNVQTKYKIFVNAFDKANIKSTTPAQVEVTVNPAPVTIASYYGVWGIGNSCSQKILDALKGVRGFFMRIAAKEINTAKDVYNWAAFDSYISILKANKLPFGVMFGVGANFGDYMYALGVPKVETTSGAIEPYYKNEVYQQLTEAFWAAAASHMRDMGFTFWQSAENTDGDEGSRFQGYGDTIKDPIKYGIAADWWTNYRRSIWLFDDAITPCNLLVNPGNQDKYGDLAWAVGHLTKPCWFKNGNAGHQFLKDGEKDQVARGWQFTENDNTHRTRTELENVDQQDPSYNDACATQQGFFALISNVDIFCISATRARYLTGLKYFNDFAGQRNPNNTRKAFVYMSCGIELTGLSAGQKAAYIQAGASEQTGFWWNDFGTNVIAGNYERWMHMEGTATPLYRLKTTGFGRYARILIDTTFTLDTRLMQPSRINVVYFDKVGTININGTTFVGTNTGQEKTVSVALANNARTFKITSTLPAFLVSTE